MTMNSKPQVEIIGAGFSGLSLAYFFVKKGFAVKIFDRAAKSGGLIHSFYENEMLIESAANGFLASKKIEELFQDINCEILKTKTESRKKFIYRQGLKRWPLSAIETIHLIGKALWSLISLQIKPRNRETLKEWAHRCLTEKANDYLLQPMVNGIFATHTDKLSAKLVLGSLFFKKEKGTSRGLVSARTGMGEVIQKMQQYLEKKGVVFEFNSQKEMYHNTFLATSSINFKKINDSNFLKSLHPLKQPINKKEKFYLANHLNLLRVTLSMKSGEALEGFGVLFPLVENFHSLGVLVNTNIFENRGIYNESWILAGSEHPEYLKLSDQEIVELIKKDRQRIKNDNFEIAHFKVVRWENVLPVYDQLLQESLESLGTETDKMTGNFLGVIGLSGIHERNYQLVEQYFHDNFK